MGNKNSDTHKLPTHNWVKIQKDRINMNQSRMTFAQNNHKSDNLYKNLNGQKYAEKYQISARQYISLEEEMEIYYYRCMTKKPLVKVYEVKSEKGKGFCSNQQHLDVYQEYIPYRLADVRNLPHDTALYVLSQALYGFQQLFLKVGSFPVDQHLIGFNNQGKAKVWYNQNFASNRNPLDGIILMGLNTNYSNLDKKMTQSQEYDMVEDIWLAIDKFSLFNEQFKQESGEFVDCNFIKARSIVQNQINRTNRVPDRVRFRQSIISRQPQLKKQLQLPQSKTFQILNQYTQQQNSYAQNVQPNIQNNRARNQIFSNGYNENFNKSTPQYNKQIYQNQNKNLYNNNLLQQNQTNMNQKLSNLYPEENQQKFNRKYY